jgi:sugar phosphate isomerase/epimerase
MRFGAMNFPVVPVLDEISQFAGMGFDYLELTMDPPMAHHSMIRRDKDTITGALKDNGMGLVCHMPTFVSTADLTESLRKASQQEMLLSLELAAELGAEKVVLHPSTVGGMAALVPETAREYGFDFLSNMVCAAGELEVRLCLENMFPRNILGVDPDYFEVVFRAFPTLELTLDTGHANIDAPGGDRLWKLVERFGKRIGHLHFSDNKGKRDDHLGIGRGSIDFARLIGQLQLLGYDDTLTLEVFDKDRRVLAESRERIKALLSH